MGKLISFNIDDYRVKKEKDELKEAVKKFLVTNSAEDYMNVENLMVAKRVEYEVIRQKIHDEKFNNMFQMGFILTMADYENSPAVIDFMAREMISEIITEEKELLEDKLHRQFETSEQFLTHGLQTYILYTIRNYDTNLCNYVIAHMELINPFKQVVNQIVFDWNNYDFDKKNANINCDDIYSLINEFILHNPEFEGMESDLVFYVKNEFGIDLDEYLKQFSDDDTFDDGTFDFDYEFDDKANDIEEEEIFQYDLKSLGLKGQKGLLELKRVIKNYLASKDKTVSYEQLALQKKK